MSVLTLEGVVENGVVRLKADVQLPDNTEVYVVVPGVDVEQVAHVVSPRLAHPEDVSDFTMEIVEGSSNADV